MTVMIHDPWALPAAYHSVIVKRDAVTQSYAGGVEAFERSFRPAKKNGALFLLHYLSKAEVDAALAALQSYGLETGVDVGATEAHRGPRIACSGLTFRSEGEGEDIQWWVNATPKKPKSSKPRRVIGSLIHYIYEDDEVEGYFDPPCWLVVSNSDQECHPMMSREHTIRVDYVEALLAAHGDISSPTGSHTIEVDDETLEQIRSGDFVVLRGRQVEDDDEGVRSINWYFNERALGAVTIFSDFGDQTEPEAVEAVTVWIDDVEWTKPSGYFE